jgi:hypothetical protein
MLVCICTKCKLQKPSDLVHFPPHNKKKNGLDSWCRVCRANYRSEINRGKFRGQLSDDEVKELKKAKYVLSNTELRKIYDTSIHKKNTEIKKMKEWEKNYSKKEKINSQLVSDRVFSMAGIINVPQKDLNMDRKFFATANESANDNLAPFE